LRYYFGKIYLLLTFPWEDEITFDFFFFLKGWIQFSYTSSHLWTLVYAIDVRRITFDQPFAAPVYHVFAWGGAVALCTAGLTLLYLPGHEYKNNNKNADFSKRAILTIFLMLQFRRFHHVITESCNHVFSTCFDLSGMSFPLYVSFPSS
jgi:hypothetical protein